MSQIQITALNSIFENDYNIRSQSESSKSKDIKELMKELSSVLTEDKLSEIKDKKYGISLQQYTDLNSYNTAMSALYGNNSSGKFQNLLNKTLGTYEDNLANAKNIIDKLKSEGMSNKTAISTYNALQKYSLMSETGNYNFINAKV